jgi:hypothetical protein
MEPPGLRALTMVCICVYVCTCLCVEAYVCLYVMRLCMQGIFRVADLYARTRVRTHARTHSRSQTCMCIRVSAAGFKGDGSRRGVRSVDEKYV